MALAHSSWLRLSTCVTLAGAVAIPAIAAATQNGRSADPASQLNLTARLSVAGMQQILRQEAMALVSPASLAAGSPKDFKCRASGKSVVCRPRRKGGVGADVTARVKPESLRLIARPDGRLDVRLPIDVTVTPVKPGITDWGVDNTGCGRTTFRVTMPFKPTFSDAGRLQFAAGKVTADNARFQCLIYTNVLGAIFGGRHEEVDVAQLIRQVMVSLGKQALAGRIQQINARLPTEQALQALLHRPAAFGSLISLGIDHPRVQLRGVRVEGEDYMLIGSLEGYPRLRFGEDWAAATDPPVSEDAIDGFRVPARLLFPTDRRLLPDATLARASSCLGAFRLQPVAGREDLAVLQRCNVDDNRNVIWLSGDDEPPPDSAIRFERPMSNVLGEIVAWLEEPDLWRGVQGVERLRREVAEFRQLVERFQADTTLPIQDRGDLSFSDLGLDLHRLWVTNEAIQADVTLVGKAELTVDLMP